MVSYYGRKRTTDTDAGLTGGSNNSNQRFSMYEPMPEHGWGHTFYILAGKPIGGTTPSGRIALSNDDSNGNPNERLAYSNTITFSGNMSSGSDGSVYSATLGNVTDGHGSTDGVMLYSGERYGLGFSATGGALYHGMIAAANPGNNYSNNNLYRKDSGSITPSEPLYTSASNEGVMTIAIGYDPNVAPSVPTDRSPGGTIQTTTPVFNSDFNDANSNRGDKLKSYQIQLRQVGQSTLKWDDTFNATGSEQSSSVTTQNYGGSALSAGTSYEWRIRHRDQFSAWSSWSSWLTFTIASAGFVGQGSSPTGKQLTRTPGPFVAQWTHGGGLSTNAVQIRLDNSGTITQISGTIAKTVANGANISLTWAETGFSAIPYGESVAYDMRARDTNGVWSDWSANRTISINAYPNKPSNLDPAGGRVVTNLPKLKGTVTDPDNSAPLSSVQARIKNEAGTVLFTRSMTLDPGSSSRYGYQTDGTDLASFGNYKWDMVASDGTLTGQYSNEETFTYAAGPSVAITAPTAEQQLSSSTPTFAWTAATQATARLDIFNSVTGAFVIGADITDAVTKSWVVPAGYLQDSGFYTFQVIVTDSLGLTGTATQDFSVVYTVPPAVPNFTASALALGGDNKPSVAFLAWEAVTDPTFTEYIIKRRLAGTLAGDSSEIILRRIPSISQVTFTDTNPISGVGYIYTLTKLIANGSDLLESLPAEAELMVEFDSIIISSTQAGESYRVVLTYETSARFTHKDDKTVFLPWGDSEPYIQLGTVNYQEAVASFRIVTDRHGAARDIIESLRALKNRQIDNVDTLCYRDGNGRRLFGYMTLAESDDKLKTYTADIGFIQTAFVEGEAA